MPATITDRLKTVTKELADIIGIENNKEVISFLEAASLLIHTAKFKKEPIY